jgi:hypothetical protein
MKRISVQPNLGFVGGSDDGLALKIFGSFGGSFFEVRRRQTDRQTDRQTENRKVSTFFDKFLSTFCCNISSFITQIPFATLRGFFPSQSHLPK